MEVAWNQLDPRLRGVDGLDDIMRFDLQHFCRRMQPPDEPHHRCALPRLHPMASPSVSQSAYGRRYMLSVAMHLKHCCMDHALTLEPASLARTSTSKFRITNYVIIAVFSTFYKWVFEKFTLVHNTSTT